MLTYIVIGIVVILAIFLCLALAVASFSSDNYYEMLKNTNEMRNSHGFTTLEYVDMINKKHFNKKLYVTQCAEYQDHYKVGMIALSEKTMYSNSLASLAIVSHELGHAKQDEQGDKLIKHWRLRRLGKICGFFFMPFVVVGAVLSLLFVFKVLTEQYILILGLTFVGVGIFIFLFSIFLKYKEIKIEKEASVFAIEFLTEFLTEKEIKLCKEFLDSARLTYWASLFKTLLGWTFLTKKDNLF